MTRLLLDVMCGGLRSFCRMCGHDTVYALDRDVEADDRLLAIAEAEDRTLVTRDVQLAERADDAVLLASLDVADQLEELAAAGVPLTLSDPPTRCSACNGRLARVPAGESTPAYAPETGGTVVWRCRDCGQCFWKGSHWDRVSERLG